MTDAEVIAALNAPQVLALTLYGEARGERIDGRAAVACVVRNRVEAARYGADYKAVCLAPLQFSCWAPKGGSLNYETVLQAARLVKNGKVTSGALRECLWIAQGIVDYHVQDITRKATHYITRDLWETRPPKWTLGLTPVIGIGAHVFFAGVDG